MTSQRFEVDRHPPSGTGSSLINGVSCLYFGGRFGLNGPEDGTTRSTRGEARGPTSLFASVGGAGTCGPDACSDSSPVPNFSPGFNRGLGSGLASHCFLETSCNAQRLCGMVVL